MAEATEKQKDLLEKFKIPIPEGLTIEQASQMIEEKIPKKKEETKPSGKADMSKEEWAEKDMLKSSSIEAQNAYSGVPAVVELLNKYPNDQLALTAYSYAMSKLGNWASSGKQEEEEQPLQDEPLCTKEQRDKILSTYQEKGYSDELAQSIMVRLFNVSSSKALTESQASEFIKILERGEYLKEPPDVPDIPF